ncbi:hypothetical protein IWW50_003065, partial [Coemansia erecta]
RIDHIDDTWVQTAPVPYDPPLTADGHKQAQQTGVLIHNLEHEALATASSAPHTEYLVLTSPFLRCAQTAEEICRGFQQRSTSTNSILGNSTWRVAVEPGLSEVMNENYFAGPLPESLVTHRIGEITGGTVCSNMRYDVAHVPVKTRLPTYPENFQNMMARFVATLDYTTSTQIDEISREMACTSGGSTQVPPRKVVIMVTHGAGVGSLLWATTQLPGAHVVPYCCLTRAQILARTSSQPLAEFGTTRLPAYLWSVDYRAYSQHIANL